LKPAQKILSRKFAELLLNKENRIFLPDYIYQNCLLPKSLALNLVIDFETEQK